MRGEAKASSSRLDCRNFSNAVSKQRPSFSRSQIKPKALLKEGSALKKSVAWHQNTDEVFIQVPVDSDIRGKDISLEIKPKRLKLALKSSGDVLLEGTMADVAVDDSFWTLETDASTGSKHVSITLAKKTMGYASWENILESEKVEAVVTDRAFFEIKIGDRVVGKILIGLFGGLVPRTVQNFKALCTGEKGQGPSGKPLHYKGTPFHRVISDFMAQGGDTTQGNGFGGESIYGEKFEDENFKLKHDARGLLAMANAGPGTNGSQFYILFNPQPHLDGKHVVFGKIEAGLDILGRIEQVASESGEPSLPVTISDSGDATFDDVEKVLSFNKQILLDALSID